MPIEISTLSDIDSDAYNAAYATCQELLQEAYPEVELARGVFNDIVVNLSAVLEAVVTTNIERYISARSMQQIQADPTLADPDIVADAVSNFNITPLPGGIASGTVTIVVNANTTVIIPSGFVLTAAGQSFVTTSAFTAQPTGSTLVSTTDRLLAALGDGTYAFVINVTAAVSGAAGNIPLGTQLVPNTLPARFVSAFATADFVGGADPETNTQLINRLAQGAAAKTLGGATNIVAAIKNQPEFTQTLDYSVIGMGDPEMSRDQHSIFPVSGGGRMDIYTQTQALPYSIQVPVTATYVGTFDGIGLWQFTLTRDLLPGFYEVSSVALPNAAPTDTGFTILQDIRGTDIRDDEFQPDIVKTEESVYTRYQTAVIQFLDTITPLAGLTAGTSTANYNAVLTGQPLIGPIQDFMSARTTRFRASDVLVRGAVPCFLTVGFTIDMASGETAPDVGAIQTAVAARVNGLGFAGRLHSSVIAAIVHASLTGTQALGTIDMFGRIRRVDGANIWIRDGSILQVPDDPVNCVSAQTVVFILDPSNVNVTVQTVNPITDV